MFACSFSFMKSSLALNAIYLCVDCSRKLWYGLAERKIAYFNEDFLDWLLVDWSNLVAHRDAAPVRYWIQIGLQIIFLVASLFVAIFGWCGSQTPEHPLTLSGHRLGHLVIAPITTIKSLRRRQSCARHERGCDRSE
jgi:hypothetical protein